MCVVYKCVVRVQISAGFLAQFSSRGLLSLQHFLSVPGGFLVPFSMHTDLSEFVSVNRAQ